MNILETLFNAFVLYPIRMHQEYGLRWTLPLVTVVVIVIGGFVWWYGSFKASYGLPTTSNADKAIFESNR
jgi:cytochrome c-type biogenesis protein CcmH/NrfF